MLLGSPEGDKYEPGMNSSCSFGLKQWEEFQSGGFWERTLDGMVGIYRLILGLSHRQTLYGPDPILTANVNPQQQKQPWNAYLKKSL